MLRIIAVAIAAVAGCAGPCETIAAERRALEHRTAAPTKTPHARIVVPFALANRVVAAALREPPRIPVTLHQLGLFAAFAPSLVAVPRGVALVPAAPGRVGLDVRVDLAEASDEPITAPLIELRVRAEVAPELHHGERLVLAFALPADQSSHIELALGDRAVEQLGAMLAERTHVPEIVAERVAKAVAEELVERGYALVQRPLLEHLGELTRIELPDLPVDRVDIASTADALVLGVVTTLPVREGVGPALPAGDAVTIQLAGSAAAELANWGIARKILPQRYTRSLAPAVDGVYRPYFDWRPHGASPFVVHLFRVEGSCAHFTSTMQPHAEVSGDQLRGWVTNKGLERADATPAFALLARVSELFGDATTPPKSTAASRRIAIGGHELRARMLRAEITDTEVRVAIGL
jgi:hypothetical protein